MAEPGAEKLNPQTHDPDHTGSPSRRRRRCRSPPRRWRWLSPPGRWRWRSPPRGWRRIGSWTRRGRSGRARLTRRRRWGRRIGVRDWRAHPDQSHPQTGCHGRAGEHLLDRHHELLALMVSGPDSAAERVALAGVHRVVRWGRGGPVAAAAAVRRRAHPAAGARTRAQPAAVAVVVPMPTVAAVRGASAVVVAARPIPAAAGRRRRPGEAVRHPRAPVGVEGHSG